MRKSLDGSRSSLIASHELQNGLKEYFDMQPLDDDFSKPALVCHMFVRCLNYFRGICYEDAHSTAQNYAQEVTEFPALYIDILVQFSFEKHLRRLMNDIECDDFGMRDIMRPEPSRIRRLLKTILNCARRIQIVPNVMKQRALEIQRFQHRSLELVETASKKKERFLEVQQAIRDDVSKAARVREALDELNADLTNFLKTQDLKLDENEKLNQQVHECEKMLAQRSFDEKMLQEDLENKKKCIIDDPQSARENMNGLRKKKTDITMELNVKTELLSALSAKLESTCFCKPDLEMFNKTASECLNSKRRVTELSRTVVKQSDVYEHLKSEKNLLLSQQQILEKQKCSKLEKGNMEEKENEKRLQRVGKRQHELKQQYNLEKHNETELKRISEHQKRYNDYVRKTEELKTLLLDEQQEIHREHTAFLERTRKYFEDLDIGALQLLSVK